VQQETQTTLYRALRLLRKIVPDLLLNWRMTTNQLVWIIRGFIVLGLLLAIGSAYGKGLWDWLDLLIVPAVIAVGVFLLDQRQRARDQAAEEDRQRRHQLEMEEQRDRELQVENQRAQDGALQTYLDQMSQLLIDTERPLHRARSGDTLSMLARARTLTMLPRLDGVRKGSVVQFLYETDLINRHAPVILLDGSDLNGANLSDSTLLGVNLSLANLRKADLNNAFLVEADLRGAQLQGANVRSSDLYGADLSLFTRTQETATLRSDKFLYTDLSNADLTGASLEGANLSQAFLNEANLYQARLSEANLYQARLGEANLSGADLSGADLTGADLRVWSTTGWPTNLRGAKGWTEEQLSAAMSLSGATMPDGQSLRDDYYIDGNPEGRPTFEEWLKSKDSEEDGENSGPS
jgi:uncharacterized protein YjbI with pentapeptide repeats